MDSKGSFSRWKASSTCILSIYFVSNQPNLPSRYGRRFRKTRQNDDLFGNQTQYGRTSITTKEIGEMYHAKMVACRSCTYGNDDHPFTISSKGTKVSC